MYLVAFLVCARGGLETAFLCHDFLERLFDEAKEEWRYGLALDRNLALTRSPPSRLLVRTLYAGVMPEVTRGRRTTTQGVGGYWEMKVDYTGSARSLDTYSSGHLLVV